MRRVIVESPYSGDVLRNLAYARSCVRDCLNRGEAPFASHLLYTQVLDDAIPEERMKGLDAGLEWMGVADVVVVYTDYGVSPGMTRGVLHAKARGMPIEYRNLF